VVGIYADIKLINANIVGRNQVIKQNSYI